MKWDGFRWIIDGHNLLLTHYDPESDPGSTPNTHAEVRQELEEAVERFAVRNRLHACIIFDGIRQPQGHPGTRNDPHLEVLYADPPAEADDLICQRAERCRNDGGLPPIVVTSDRKTLVPRLTGLRVVSSSDFFRVLQSVDSSPSSGKPEFRDPELERMFLELEKDLEPPPAPPEPVARPAPAVPAPRPDPRAGLAAKKEKGKLKQMRRLANRRKKNPRR